MKIGIFWQASCFELKIFSKASRKFFMDFLNMYKVFTRSTSHSWLRWQKIVQNGGGKIYPPQKNLWCFWTRKHFVISNYLEWRYTCLYWKRGEYILFLKSSIQSCPILISLFSREEITWSTWQYCPGFRKFWSKNFIFSIFFKLSQVLPNDVKTVPKCFPTLKATPKASEHILGPFEFFPHRIFYHQKPFLLMGLTESLKMPIYESFQNLKAFSRWKLCPRYDTGSFFGS